MPVPAIGGAESLGDQVAATMKLAADDVQALAIPGCGHHPAAEAPEATLTALTVFLALYRDGRAAAHSPGPPANGAGSVRGMADWVRLRPSPSDTPARGQGRDGSSDAKSGFPDPFLAGYASAQVRARLLRPGLGGCNHVPGGGLECSRRGWVLKC